jgi:hypothetical protein
MSSELKFNPNAVCNGCGRFGAYEFDGERLCAECYEARGSCCLEFGGDDLWKDAENVSRDDNAPDESAPDFPSRH